MFIRDDRAFKAQAEANLITIDLHNIETGRLANKRYGGKTNESPIWRITGIMSKNLKMNFQSKWNESSFPFSMPGKLGSVQDFISDTGGKYAEASGNQKKAYQAGPFSSQKYQGIEDIAFDLEFTTHSNTEDILGFDMDLSKPLEALYWLMLCQLPKEGRGDTEQMMKQMTGMIMNFAKGLNVAKNFAGEIISGKTSAKELLDPKLIDNGMATLNANPGNWITQITLGNLFKGWLVIKNVSMDISNEKDWDGNPLCIDFKLNVKNYMIPDKAAMVGSKADIVDYNGPDKHLFEGGQQSSGISEFSKMYIINGNRATKAQRETMNQGASGLNKSIK